MSLNSINRRTLFKVNLKFYNSMKQKHFMLREGREFYCCASESGIKKLFPPLLLKRGEILCTKWAVRATYPTVTQLSLQAMCVSLSHIQKQEWTSICSVVWPGRSFDLLLNKNPNSGKYITGKVSSCSCKRVTSPDPLRRFWLEFECGFVLKIFVLVLFSVSQRHRIKLQWHISFWGMMQ